jgi:hypothetical protein
MDGLSNQTKKFYRKHASTVLTIAGGIGVIATTVTAVKATPKALELISSAEQEKGEELTKMEKFKIAGSKYVPSILIGSATLACIFGANILNKRHQAALVSAYTLVDSSFKEYKRKIAELYGEDANKEVTREMAEDRYKDYEPEEKNSDTRLFFDNYSMRYFESTMENVLRAEYELNKRIALNSGAFVNEFYELLDIPKTDYGAAVGWSQGILSSMYWDYWLDFDHDEVVMDDGLECCIISFRHEPVADFEYY